MELKHIFQQVAMEHGVTVDEIRNEIQAAINEAVHSPNTIARFIPCQGHIPTPEELIAFAVSEFASMDVPPYTLLADFNPLH